MPTPPASGTLGARRRRLGPEVRLPTWMTPKFDVNTRLFDLLQHAAEASVPVRAWMRRLGKSHHLSLMETAEVRLEFLLPLPVGDRAELTVTSWDGATSGSVRTARSRADYDLSPEPIWWADAERRQLRVKNLHMTALQLAGSGQVYSLMEAPLLETGLAFRAHPAQNWEWLPWSALALSGTVFQLPVSGTIQALVGSPARAQALLAGAQLSIQWPGGGTITQTVLPQTPANRFDAWGQLLGLPRLDGETNDQYQRRLIALAMAPGDPTLPGVTRGIGLPFGLVSAHAWDGVTPLSLDSDGSSGITALTVVGEPRWLAVTEALTTASGNVLFYATYPNWRSGALVTVDGLPTVSYALSGNRLLFTPPVTGRVSAEYSVERYHFSLLAGGTLGSVQPGTGMPSGSYTVLATHQVRVRVPELPEVQRLFLLTPEGLPNPLFLELAHRLAAHNPTTLGRARWGPLAAWVEGSEARPPAARLPLPFDLNL